MGESQKKKRPFWKTILIFILVYIVAKVIGDVWGRQQARNEGYLTGNDLMQTYKKEHLDSCVKTDSSEAICSCTFDGLINQLGLNGYTEMAKIYTEKGYDAPEAEKYIKTTLEELLKCRQK